MKPSHIVRLIVHERTALVPAIVGVGICAALGVPLEFLLFGVTLFGVAVFHRHTLRVALAGLACIVLYKLFAGFKTGPGVEGLALHMAHEWVVLANLLGLLLGFALLSRHFEKSGIPDVLPRFLPSDWKGGFVLLVIIFVLSSFLDNIAAALIGATVANAVFRGRVHIGYLVAIVAASNAGGSGSVIGDTTTTMMWIDGVNPVDVFEAFVAAGVALLIFGFPAALQQERYSPLTRETSASARVDWVRIVIVGIILLSAIVTNVVVNLKWPALADGFPFLGVAVWVAILATATWRDVDWHVLPDALKGSIFLLALILCASFMPVEKLPPASWQTALGLGFVSAVFDNIPLTALALNQGGYDWGFLAYAVGFGGSMIWFGSSAGVAVSNMFPQAKSVGLWLRHGWHVVVAYVVGYFALLGLLGWHPNAPHKAVPPDTGPALTGPFLNVQFGVVEIALLAAFAALMLAILYNSGTRERSFVREFSRGDYLRELNSRLAPQEDRSPASVAAKARIGRIVGVALAMAAIAIGDAQIGQISFWPLYLGPVVYVSCVSGFAKGAVTACVAGMLLVLSVGFSGHPYMNEYFFALATLSQVAALLVVAWLANRAAEREQRV